MHKIILVFPILAMLFVTSCEKVPPPTGGASLTIVNAVNGSDAFVTNFTPKNPKESASGPLQYYNTANTIYYASYWESASYIENTYLELSQLSDTNAIFFAGNFNLPIGSVHTLYLAGDTTSLDTLYATDVIPYYPSTDSVTGVRFVNLVEHSQPISINITGTYPDQSEFTGIAYKEISAFKTYPTTYTSPKICKFEIRDESSGTLLRSFSWTRRPFKNQTIVIAGSEVTPSNFRVITMVVNNY